MALPPDSGSVRSVADPAPVIEAFTVVLSDTNLVTLAWDVRGVPSDAEVSITGLGLRPARCSAAAPAGCSATVRIASPRYAEYTLTATSEAGGSTSASAGVLVPGPSRPVVEPRVHVDVLAPAPQELRWALPGTPDPDRFVQVTAPGAWLPEGWNGVSGTKFPASGSLEVGVDELPVGGSTWRIASCIQPEPGATPLCGRAATTTFAVEAALLAGPYRRFVPAGKATTIAWSGSGSSWVVTDAATGTSTRVTRPSITIPASAMAAGVHNLTVVSCDASGRCSDQVTRRSPRSAGAVENAVGRGSTGPVTRAQLLVGPKGVVDWDVRSVTSSFEADVVDTSNLDGTGSPLDVAFSGDGDLWSIGEFARAVASTDGTAVAGHAVPLAPVGDPATGQRSTRPFRNPLNPTILADVSALGERAIGAGSVVWFAQGGMLFAPATGGNHSRLVRYDPAGVDSPTTAFDDRFCAVKVPGEGNEVIGIGYDPHTRKVWFSQRETPSSPPRLGWFIDGSVPCGNLLDFEDQAAVDAADAETTCRDATSSGCIHLVDLPVSAGVPARKVGWLGHLAVDPVSGSVWVISYTGALLMRYSPATGTVISIPLPTPVQPHLIGSLPWQIRVDGRVVYLIDYLDGQVLRVALPRSRRPKSCEVLVRGANPCISELFLPIDGVGCRAHSIALEGDRLWFTVANEERGPADPRGSYFGYLDLMSWAAGSPTGVRFTDLHALGRPPDADHWSVRGIELRPDGVVGLAEMGKALLRLTPREPELGRISPRRPGPPPPGARSPTSRPRARTR